MILLQHSHRVSTAHTGKLTLKRRRIWFAHLVSDSQYWTLVGKLVWPRAAHFLWLFHAPVPANVGQRQSPLPVCLYRRAGSSIDERPDIGRCSWLGVARDRLGPALKALAQRPTPEPSDRAGGESPMRSVVNFPMAKTGSAPMYPDSVLVIIGNRWGVPVNTKSAGQK